MTILGALLLLLHFTLVPLAVGRLITYPVKNPLHKQPAAVYVLGLFASFGVFFILYGILVWFQYWNTFDVPFTGCFTALVWSYSVVIALLVVLWLWLDRAAIKGIFSYIRQRLSSWQSDIKGDVFVLVYGIIFAAVLLAQLYFAYGYEVNEWSYDDYDYVVNSQDMISSDTLSYVSYTTGEMPNNQEKRVVVSWPAYISYLAKISGFEVTTVAHTIMHVSYGTGEMPNNQEKRVVVSWPAYISYLAKISGFEVTTVAHTIMPPLFLLIAYLVYFYLSGLIFTKLDNRLIFMILLAVGFAFGLHSHYSVSFRLLCTIWQGKAILSAIVVPFMITHLAFLYSDKVDRGNLLPLVSIAIGSCSLTTMSMLLFPMTVILMWLVMSIYNRRLYEVSYLIACLAGPLLSLGFYFLITILFSDMQGLTHYFIRGRDINWWYKWFGSTS